MGIFFNVNDVIALRYAITFPFHIVFIKVLLQLVCFFSIPCIFEIHITQHTSKYQNPTNWTIVSKNITAPIMRLTLPDISCARPATFLAMYAYPFNTPIFANQTPAAKNSISTTDSGKICLDLSIAYTSNQKSKTWILTMLSKIPLTKLVDPLQPRFVFTWYILKQKNSSEISKTVNTKYCITGISSISGDSLSPINSATIAKRISTIHAPWAICKAPCVLSLSVALITRQINQSQRNYVNGSGRYRD